ncbi:K02A2.6-like [Cordylochernes scorpioides]|uniref:RNA-directed DNA polymerase n=1 Tax=Cordylochernes scorpioides TaxID=51811 RepID=A0ABY6K7H2_9ARAC|nr:K02A2.6-like [Cordylochernes scorpioides]
MDQRTCIKFCVKNEIKCANAFRMLTVAYGEATLDRCNVYRWYKMFSEGREDVNDEERAGRPSTTTTDEKINEVENMILANRRIKVREVAEDLNILIGSCHSIFINDLGMRRVAAKFVPKLLNCDQKQHRMNIANKMLDSVRDDPNLLQRVIPGDEAWVYGYDVETKAQSSQWKLPHEPRPKKARQVRSNVKGRTVNKEYYLQFMRNLREAIHQKRPDLWKNKNWLLHHDNAPSYTSLLVRDFMAKNNTLMMPQPPYSPELAPCDFFLFPKLKRPMKGRRYATLDEIKTASKEELKKIKKKKKDFLKCFEDWKNRWHKCIISHGDYFEGDKIADKSIELKQINSTVSRMEGIKPPAEFVPYSNEKKWETWRESFEIFAIAVNLESMPLVRQRAILKHIAEYLIRDRLIIGILDREVKRKLLEDPQLTLPRAISIAMISESTFSQVASLNEQKMIEKIEKRNWVKDTIRMENEEAGSSGINPRRGRIIEPCKWCGQRHKYGKCPAYGKKCNACGKTNHFSVVCRTKRIRNLLAESEAEESCDDINLNEVVVKTVGSDKWSAVIIINGKKTTVHLDTGAQINVLPHKVINQWPSRPEIRPTSLKAFAYGNTELPIVGKCNVLCQYGEKKGMFEFIVADVEAQTLITGDTCEKLEILRRINHINTDEMKLCSETQKILEQYHEVFQGVGLINSESELLHEIPKAKYYTVLDVKSAYWHIPVAKECRDLLVMTTPFGKFRYNRLPFGLKISAQIFVEKMTNIFRDSFQNITYVDDLLIYADTIQERNKKLKGILEKAKEKNIKFDLTKAQICLTKVRFLGHLISQNGIDPEPNKIDKLITFKRPEDKKSLHRIMGLYNYLGKFIPNLAASTSNIRGILRKNVVWHWGPKQDGEFDHIKECVRNAPSLAHFDKSKMLILQCDASKDAMGAALLQEDRPLAFASASFSDSQKQYSQIEKELLSTDHQPLLPLVKKPLSDISPRQQRLVMKLIAFDFKLQYKPGKYLIVADTLSRDTHPMDELPTPFLEDKRMVKMVCVNISDEKLVAMQKDTREDPALVKVIDYVIEGWPICKKDVDEDAKVFFDFRHRLYLWNDLLCIGSAIVIPKTQRNNMLNLLHQSHQGISAIQGLARESLFWPRMSIDIAEKVKNCEICQKYQKSKIRQPLKPFPVPDYPWQTVSLDIFYIQKKPHLLVVDRYSGYPEVFALDPPTAINVKNKLRETFARFGIPETMMSDNGPPFRSEIMTDFCIRWGIKQLFSSPHLHRSNGLAERNIQTIKNQLIKCRDEGSDPYLAILAYRNTPKNDLPSPAQLCLSRSLRCQIPRITPLYRPYQTNWRSIENAKRKRRSSMKEHYDRNSKSYPKVNVGEDAWCQMHPRETWTPVKISALADSPQSFEVVTPSGNRLIRNQQFIRPRDGVNEKRHCLQNQLPAPQKLNICITTVQRWASHPQPRYSGQVKRPILTRGKARLHPLRFHQNHPEGPESRLQAAAYGDRITCLGDERGLLDKETSSSARNMDKLNLHRPLESIWGLFWTHSG